MKLRLLSLTILSLPTFASDVIFPSCFPCSPIDWAFIAHVFGSWAMIGM